MKLATIFAIAALSEAKKAKKPKTPQGEAEKLKKHINFVWDKWYKNCHHGPKGDAARNRYIKLVDRCVKHYDNCGNDPNADAKSRKRRDEDNAQILQSSDLESICEDEDGDNNCVRLSKDDRGKAVKQLGNILTRWGALYMGNCDTGLTADKIADKADKWRNVLNNKKCYLGTRHINKHLNKVYLQ